LQVQLALLTAIVKLFIRRPTAAQDLLPKVLKLATEEAENPDLRDRVSEGSLRLVSRSLIVFRASCIGDF